MISIYRGEQHTTLVSQTAQAVSEDFSFDSLFQADDPQSWLQTQFDALEQLPLDATIDLGRMGWLPPVGSQEIWAAGVTYYRSRTARMEEAEVAGGDVFYDRVYEAERPELFFKSVAKKARGNRAPIRVREDSTWDVPEPELTLAINSKGRVFGFTIGNDVSSRSIEGENPLYLPQAKVYRGSCAIGPALVVGDAVSQETAIRCVIERNGQVGFEGETQVNQIKRGFDELAGFLFRENEFPDGALLMTGTGIVPGDDFTLQVGDTVKITIDGLGTLENEVGE